jgi:hypothetical protein
MCSPKFVIICALLICLAQNWGRAMPIVGQQGDHEMFRIEKDSSGCVTKLRLSGRIQSDQIASIRSQMDEEHTTKVLDLSEVTLADLGAVRFLIRCEDEGVQLVECPSYVREWMLRERAEGGQLGFSTTP